MRFVLKTLGCKANFYDSALIEREFRVRGWTPWVGKPQGADSVALCIVNSCTVTDEADLQSRKLASRLAREYPQAKIVITGCSAEVDPERLRASKGVDYVIGNRDKPQLVELLIARAGSTEAAQSRESESMAPDLGTILGEASGYAAIRSQHPIDREWPMPGGAFLSSPLLAVDDPFAAKTRAFLKIQEGCNAFCTYCIIPYGRGPSRSLRPREVIEQVRELVATGTREVVITGTNIGDYGTDWSDDDAALASSCGSSPGASAQSREDAPLTELLEMILRETRLERLRLSSLDPTEVTPGILRLMEREPRLCPHFHMSIQSVNSRILRLMKRRYGLDEVRERLLEIASLKLPGRGLPGGVFVGMDLITGFPSESAEEFDEGVRELERLPWTRLHVFPYSERAGTPAVRIAGSVPQAERLRRSRKLNELSLVRFQSRMTAVLAECRAQGRGIEGVLLENGASGIGGEVGARPGYSTNYLRVLVETAAGGDELLRNQRVSVIPQGLVTDARNGDVCLTGQAQKERSLENTGSGPISI